MVGWFSVEQAWRGSSTYSAKQAEHERSCQIEGLDAKFRAVDAEYGALRR
jgi:hypothetical protein